MLIFLLKFSACLCILLVFYKLLLEKENFHVFKRSFLLASIVIALIIPFITFTYYIEPNETVINQNINNGIINQNSDLQFSEIILFTLWLIYSIGVVIFSIKFFKNLSLIFFRIKRNTKVKSKDFTSVLLRESIVPHTFFNFIFFNKNKFEKQQIPQEVILHEQTHAKQKHSIDILFIEFIQIIFWFHPLLYLLNKAIKLNHEFLADQAVLKSGTTLSNYQKILLAFSSNATHSPLANAINYSFIKKRFTVMKTQTSKKSIWLKSLLLLPLFSFLLFSFSTKVEIEKENTLIETITAQEGASNKQVAEYNKLAKKYNAQEESRIIIKKKEVERLNYLYNLMTKTQKKSVEPFPNFPPPPPVPKVVVDVNDINSNIPPPPAPKVIKGINDVDSSIPPPPPAPKKRKIKKKEKVMKTKEKKMIAKEKALINKEKEVISRQKFLKEKQLALNETKKYEIERVKTLELKKKFIEEKKVELSEKKRLIEEKKKQN